MAGIGQERDGEKVNLCLGICAYFIMECGARNECTRPIGRVLVP